LTVTRSTRQAKKYVTIAWITNTSFCWLLWLGQRPEHTLSEAGCQLVKSAVLIFAPYAVSKPETEELLSDRLREIEPHITQEEPSVRGKLFAWLADLTDEDGAYTELQDLDPEGLGGWPIDEL
jgi:hypothetical protein